MRALLRWTVGLIVIVHGLLHLPGVVTGFGWADVSQLAEPIGTATGGAWLAAALLLVAAGALLITGVRWWWALAAVAAVVSQAVILTSWSDAKAGTAANVLLALAAVYGYRSQGPTSFRAQYRHLAQQTIAAAASAAGADDRLVSDDDLARLPPPVAGYVRASEAIGRAHVTGFRADISGRIRGGADEPWMRWTGAQVNTFGAAPSRVFFMDATMKGIPTDIFHVYVGPTATMRVRVASLVPIVDASGPEMDQAETVTLLNDLCILAPAALVDAPIEWSPIDDHHAQAKYTNAGRTVSAVLTFDDQHELTDFVSDDRLRSSPDGSTFTPQRWSTPISDYRTIHGRRVAATGRARWHPDGEPSFDYLEFHADDITYLERTAPSSVDGDPDHARPTVRRSAGRRPHLLLGALLVATGAILAAAGVGLLPHLVEHALSISSVLSAVLLVSGLVALVLGARSVLRGRHRVVKALGGLAIVVAVAAAVSVISPSVAATHPPRAEVTSTPAALGLAYEAVTVTTTDDVKLAAWYIKGTRRSGVVVLHGAGSTRSEVLRQAAALTGSGFAVLLVDARGHGDSHGTAMDFGWFGDRDIAAGTEFLASRPEIDADSIGVVGFSMGGEEAIGAAATDQRIRAVVAEGATARLAADKEWLSDVYGWRGGLQVGLEHVQYGIADLLTDASPPIPLRSAAAGAPRTRFLLITAGNVDDEAHAAAHIRGAAPDRVTVWTVSGADHTGGYQARRGEWQRRVVDFLDDNLG